MITLRIATAVATTLVGGSSLFTECEPPADPCPASAPEEGCECEVEGAYGCTDNGDYNAEGFVCVEGAWTDLAGTPDGDQALCGYGFYGGCYYNAETNDVEILCAVPGFIGISKARRRTRTAKPRRLRAAA